MDTIYIEEQVRRHARTEAILKRFPNAQQIIVERYSEVFNPHAQNFRIQKQNPSLILAAKANKKVLPTPTQYETGGGANYYFSHMLNCLYDCRYCFLQGMFRSANYLLFVNYEAFVEEIEQLAAVHRNDEKPAWFFSGYDCDSLALEPVSGFAQYFVPKFKALHNAVLELRTKSTQIRWLLDQRPINNVVIAYSLSPISVAEAVESGAPSLQKRIDALLRLQKHGWRVGLRFDPIIWHQDYQADYQCMIETVFDQLDAERIDSVTLGGFRLPKSFYKTMRSLHPQHWLFSAGLSEEAGMISYTPVIEHEMFANLREQALRFIAPEKLFSYPVHGGESAS
ncbi:MAG: DNA photolyase [Gammaproteobacteria bacterium]|nr:DNA photolyase [Gammaproteobacteria bacterium]